MKELMNKRWYDIDPTVSLAVSLMRNANEQTQVKCADYIIDFAKQRNIVLKSNSLNDAFNYILRRWYDRDEKIAEAFEYFQFSPLEIQKEISLEVISFLQLSESY
ncbi:MAG: hypothetical protein WCG95_03305 [bacterium]